VSAPAAAFPPEDSPIYPRGEGPRLSASSPRLRPLEWLALTHAAILLLWTTWGYGGAAEWMRPYFTWFGGLGVLITLGALADRDRWRDGSLRALWWLVPWLAFNAFVLIGTLNPSLREIAFGNDVVLAHTGGRKGWPSSARPHLALPSLLLFDALWITCFNVGLVVRQRRALRGLLLLLVINALALSVFGTVQKLAQAKGIYFGQVVTRQTYFFSSFVYHNHWGSFIVLTLAACLGLIWHHARRHDARNFFHSPAFGGLVALFFLAATVPLSGSRSCTLAMLVLFAGAFVHWIVKMVKARRRQRESAVPPLLGACAALLLGVAGVWYVARDTITARANLTRDQVSTMVQQGGIGSRSVLYRDTWRMASYPHVFGRLFNTQTSVDRLPVFYRDAHSDWLQAFAEHGFVGSALLALIALVPLLGLRARHLESPVPQFLLAGCALLLLYAWIEFPFGNVSVVLTWWLCFFCAVRYARLQDRDAPTVAAPSPTPMP
jgi:hypothetical protein